MTNEEAREVLQEQIDRYGQEYDEEGIDALEMAIQIIKQYEEQTNQIDEIRAEIVDLAKRTMNDNRANGMWKCVEIIDKHTARMEAIKDAKNNTDND